MDKKCSTSKGSGGGAAKVQKGGAKAPAGGGQTATSMKRDYPNGKKSK